MGEFRVYVEKKSDFQTEKEALLIDLNENLHLNLKDIRLLNIYDIFHVTKDELVIIQNQVLSEKVTDQVYHEIKLPKQYLALEYLPGQYDLRQDSAEQCIKLLISNQEVIVKTGTLILFYEDVDLNKIKKYLINPIEKREKDLLIPLYLDENIEVKDINSYDQFINYTFDELSLFYENKKLAMSIKDLAFIQSYFKDVERRNPTEVELAVIDTYWSDHCRHTTFETIINKVTFPKNDMGYFIEEVFNDYIKTKKNINEEKKPITLMDLATIYGKQLKKIGKLNDLEVSDENNACSLYVDVNVNGKMEKWLLMFKNETHNHPTEIEPFGGASTCIGGAIRDPLSGRAYVYQAMRITGAGNILEPVDNTIEGKLPQKLISKNSALGYSSYGNQIGLATTFVREIYHEGYKAKRMEVGAVVGAAPLENVRRDKPVSGDCIILLGGRTGRDGIGGATGSSQKHDETSIQSASQEVQKGNAPTERKIQRLFRKKEVTQLIKKSNDFGAGGVAVAIGELAPGVEIYLDQVILKYKGLNPLEIAISESQERMAVVVSEQDVKSFIEYANEENLEATVVAKVTNSNYLVMKYHEKTVVNISRDFLNTNGVRNEVDVIIPEMKDKNIFDIKQKGSFKEQFLNNLKQDNIASQKGLVEMFDSTIGATTILLPFGGKYQLTESDASVQKIPVLNGETTTCSIMSYGFNPFISSQSPFHGAVYAVIESIAKVVAVGGDYRKIRFSFQEYFKKLGTDPRNWSQPFLALLGAFYTQDAFSLPSIGGKDSMSGSFNELHVPPTLISFAVSVEEVDQIISQEFRAPNHYIYLFDYEQDNNQLPMIDELKTNYKYIYQGIKMKKIVSACSIKMGGLAEALAKMSFGNKIGVDVIADMDLFKPKYGSIVVESTEELTDCQAIYLGKTTDAEIQINQNLISIDEAIQVNQSTYDGIYPRVKQSNNKDVENSVFNSPIIKKSKSQAKPKVFIPVFPGTNCEYETGRAFQRAGALAETFVFKNLNQEMIHTSLTEMVKHINQSQILMFSGGFSAGDEPDGSGKFITTVLNNEMVKEAIERFLDKDGLILGICNGFQALIKSGLLPYGKIGVVSSDSPTLTKNDINRHVAKIVNTKITSNKSPWLMNMSVNKTYQVAMSHGEGKFVASDEMIKQLFNNGQVATQYVDLKGQPTMDARFNPNGSYHAIEGITSPCGKILGKMGHSERMVKGLYKNMTIDKVQDIFTNGVGYFK
ncbi:phosphoribosylformylglycinamidine synthase [Mycoplasmatota bacterium]|nr:phosphoribosylformylglycinamidine synthase [Mycoplasmatota bacterium]